MGKGAEMLPFFDENVKILLKNTGNFIGGIAKLK